MGGLKVTTGCTEFLLHEILRVATRIVRKLAEAYIANSLVESTGLKFKRVEPHTVAPSRGRRALC
jgi:hypothetical protein